MKNSIFPSQGNREKRIREKRIRRPEPTDRNNSNTNTATMARTTSPFDAELQDILNRVLNVDLSCTPPQDVVEGLANDGCFTWILLQSMAPTDINSLYKLAGNSHVPLMGHSVQLLRKFLEHVEDNRINNVPDPFLTTTHPKATSNMSGPTRPSCPPTFQHHRIPMSSPLQNRNSKIASAVSDPNQILKSSMKTSTTTHGRSLLKVKLSNKASTS